MQQITKINCFRLLALLTISFLGAGEGYGQLVGYAGLSGGVGSYINRYDASLLNYFNPRRTGPEANAWVGGQMRRSKRLGWQLGVTYRDVRHFTLGQLYDPALQAAIDTLRSFDRTGFILLPAYLTYRLGGPTWQVGLRAGLYAGWKLYATRELTSPSGFKQITPIEWTQFPKFDAFGGQAGVELMYKINSKISLYTEARLIVDASGLIFPRYHAYVNPYANYQGRALTVGINYHLK